MRPGHYHRLEGSRNLDSLLLVLFGPTTEDASGDGHSLPFSVKPWVWPCRTLVLGALCSHLQVHPGQWCLESRPHYLPPLGLPAETISLVSLPVFTVFT